MKTEVCVVGFGLAAVPLVRELDRLGVAHQIISNGESHWKKLDARGRLDFDLVSSYLTSFFSFDQEPDKAGDYFPTAREFYAKYQERLAQYQDRILDDRVERIVNYDDRSIVTTEGGERIEASHVVIATGFSRSLQRTLATFDYDIQDKTVLFDVFGDSPNLMLAKLLPNGNRAIVRTNGFVPLDKVIEIGDELVTFDQLELHNLAKLSRSIYMGFIGGGSLLPFDIPLVTDDTLYARHPEAYRWSIWRQMTRAPWVQYPPSGAIAIKHWPIQTYERAMGEDLEASIRAGYLLNDISYFIDRGMVRVCRKGDSRLDLDAKLVHIDGEVVPFDVYVNGDREAPRIPELVRVDARGVETPFEYRYREAYFGVIPRALRNVYCLGYARPITGGLANIVEMQCLLATKMIADDAFRDTIYRQIHARIRRYDLKYYGLRGPTPTDHLVYYGFYNEEIAKVLGIDLKLSEHLSLDGLLHYFCYPNDTLKYRASGEFAIEGGAEMVRAVGEHQRSGYIAILRVIALMVLAPHLAQVSKLSLDGVDTRLRKLLATRALAGLNPPLGAAAEGLLTLQTARERPALRRAFNDVEAKQSPRYDAFWDRYVEAYRKVHPIRAEIGEAPAPRPPALSEPGRKIAIVGGGAAGLVTAYLLAGRHQVTVFEGSAQLGGHIRTINRNVSSPKVPRGIFFENGVVTYNRLIHPTFHRLLGELGVSSRQQLVSSGMFSDDEHLLSMTHELPKRLGLLGSARQMLKHYRPARGQARVFTKGLQGVLRGAWHPRVQRDRSMREFLPAAGTVYADWLRSVLMLNYSTPFEEVGELPAELAVPMLLRSLNPLWSTIPAGFYSYIERILERVGDQIDVHLEAPVASVARDPEGVTLTLADGERTRADAVVFAGMPHAVLSLLSDPTPAERRQFTPWKSRRFATLAHDDLSMYARHGLDHHGPADYFENPEGEIGYTCCFTGPYELPPGTSYSMSHNLDAMIAPERVVDRFTHTVPRYTVDALRTRPGILASNGHNRTFHAGAYLGDAMHEGAVRSAVDVSAALGGRSI